MPSSTAFLGSLQPCSTPQRAQAPRRRSAVAPQAIFGRKQQAAVLDKPAEPEVQEQRFSLFGRSKKAAAEPAQSAKNKKPLNKAEEYKKRQGAVGRTLGALDFAEVRSKSDAELLYEAKYGQRSEDGRMSREQYRALRRKIGGTAKDYWKDWVDVKGQYVEKGYVSTEQSSVPGLPFLIGTVLALLAATVFVVSST